MKNICVLLLLLIAVPNIYAQAASSRRIESNSLSSPTEGRYAQENNTQDASALTEKENSWLSYFFANPVKQNMKIIPYKQAPKIIYTGENQNDGLSEGPGLLFFILDSVQSRREPVGYHQYKEDRLKQAEEGMKIIERIRR